MHFVQAKNLLSAGNGMNIYRGCTHGCIYCDTRSKCYGFTHPFEDIEVKENAPFLLEQRLRSKRSKCMIGTGSMNDPYMPCEKELKLTRQCLEIIDRYEFGVAVQTKSDLILRDMDLLKSINKKSKAVVEMTLTTFDNELCHILEPNVCDTKARFEVLMRMKEEGIPTVVWLDPILPFINDTRENIEGILDYCIKAQVKGILCFAMGVTLREGSREYFYQALDKHFPGMRKKYCQEYGMAYELNSPRNEELMQLFRARCVENGILHNVKDVFSYMKVFPTEKLYKQISLFDM